MLSKKGTSAYDIVGNFYVNNLDYKNCNIAGSVYSLHQMMVLMMICLSRIRMEHNNSLLPRTN